MDLNTLLNQLGIKTELFSKVRLGNGVVGKTSHVAFAAIVVLGLATFGLDGELKLLPAGGVLLVFFYYFDKIIKFAEKNPAAALLEGAELVQYKQIELASKENPNPLETTPVANIQESKAALVKAEVEE